MARLHIHPVGLFLLFFGLLSWVVALGGLGASTNDCMNNRPPGAKADYCANMYQTEWWTIWFEFFLLVIMLLTCFTTAFERGRYIYLTYLAMVTVQLTYVAQKFITNSFTIGGLTFNNYKSEAYNAAAAGAVLLCITNYALIIFVGLGATAAPGTSGLPTFTPLSMQMGSSAPVPAATSAPTTMEQKYQPSTYQPSNF
ncbi:hypothetical protein HYH02_008306 [Chlamydomonas schloesseri]|uniref:Uncharacterized protein n=1 Tax=Chlamydomonas schloesseri TaxID=2026947 RepID=A0A835WGU4_9CHLO|nr:hypothetical protein HYH02_008306 [Chlamydomonas schloesseri]|eukprot:KAG2446745.1 hypothetical protein HYH02_008306 [Chlamydomonas schloesseri]